MPRQAAGKRIRVKLRNGSEPAEDWAADGRAGCNWVLLGKPFDILMWKVI